MLSGADDRINDSAAIILNGGTATPGVGLAHLDTQGLGETVGALTLSSHSVIDLGATNMNYVLRFADSDGNTWSGTLSIWNWSGTTLAGGGGLGGAELDQVFFTGTSTYGTTTGSGLSAPQLGQITFFSDNGMTSLGATVFGNNGQIVPVPEPTGVLVGLAMFGLAGLRERRRSNARRREERLAGRN
jgi:hypothetical protein